MAHIQINVNEFEDLLGRRVTDGELDEASFLGAHWSQVEGEKWDVEVYPDRPDLLSVEGLARAYRGFFGDEHGAEQYSVGEPEISLEVDSSVEEVRPHIGGAVVRGLELDERAINGLIQLQEKLHETMGRERDKLAIGLHDLEPLEPPFRYRAAEPGEVSFTPLEHDDELRLGEILEEHEKGQEYSWILEDEDLYPVIEDADGQVLSFPPIINNQLTEVGHGTEDVFIDVTGKDAGTVRKVLNILVTALAERGGEIEAVDVDGEEMPDLEPDRWEIDADYFRDVSGLELEPGEIAERLEMMRMDADASGGELEVEVPAYRNDVMHPYDIVEDAVIAHRYSNIEPEMPEIDQVAEQKPATDFADLLRDIMVGTGALETHTYVLSSPEKLFDRMEMERRKVVKMSNALTEDYSAVRDRLLPSLMEVLNSNRQHTYPQKFFEVAEVAVPDSSSTGASNSMKLAYLEADSSADYTDARELIQVLERELDVDLELEPVERGCFMDSRAAEVFLDGESIGFVGQLSGKVLKNWELEDVDAAGFELDVERLMELSG